MSHQAFDSTYKAAAERSGDPQERNRAWWESLPMTYAAWDDAKRVPSSAADFEAINRAYLSGNPWIGAHVPFAAFKGKRVLEIGCGAGSAACLFAKSGAFVTAVDLTEQAVAMTRANAAAQGLANVEIARMDAERLTFPDASFDYVYSWGVIHHSSAPQAIFDHIGRVLRPGGAGLVMVYNRDSLRYWLKGLYWLLAKGKLFAGESMSSVQRFFTDGFFHRHYSGRALRAALGKAGLDTVRMSRTHMSKTMIPLVPVAIDEALKSRWGWLLVAEFRRR